jgi:ABC-2 type transport system ATP-binding protein
MAVPAVRVDDLVVPRLSLRGITFGYGERPVLEGLSFDVRPGEVFGLLGPNGAGKSTLFSILTGLFAVQAGEIRLDGLILPFGSPALRARTGVVFQEPSLDLRLTARENLLLGAALFRVPRADARARAGRLLAAAGLEERAGEQVGRLSGGMRRRLELARALIHQPSILILDEPTSGLDAAAFRRTWETLLELRRQEGLTLLVTTHRPDEGERCDRLAVLAQGRIVACEPPEVLKARVAGDVLEVEADEPGALAAEIAARLRLRARSNPRGVTIEHERGHELVPRLVEAFPPGRFRSIAVRRPTLADAFLDLTGRALADEARVP